MGIFASNDQMAVGFIHAALEKKVKIPGDYFIIGYSYILKLYSENIFLCVTI